MLPLPLRDAARKIGQQQRLTGGGHRRVMEAPTARVLAYYSTRVEEICPNDNNFADEEAMHKQHQLNEQLAEHPSRCKVPTTQPLNENIAEHPNQLKLLMQKLSSAQQTLLAQNEQTLATVEKACIDTVRNMEADITKLHTEKRQLEEELERRGRTPWPSAPPASQGLRPIPVTPPPIIAPSDAGPAMVGLAVHCADGQTSEEAGRYIGRPASQLASRPTSRATSRPTSRATNRPTSRLASRAVSRALSRRISGGSSVSETWNVHSDVSVQNGQLSQRKARKTLFVDANSMKERVKQAVMKPVYNVFDYYHSEGIFQFIAKSTAFDTITLCMVFLNTLWIWIDTDYRTSDVLLEAEPVFVAVENYFCAFFSLELFIRFMAFERKRNCVKDAWFAFDMVLVVLMIVETWVMMVAFAVWPGGAETTKAGTAQFQIVRVAKIMRITKMVRMVRLLRAVPELMVLVKSVVVALRSVFFTLCLLVIVIYLFALVFVQLQQSSLLENAYEEHFMKVPDAMLFLLLRGILPDLADNVYSFGFISPMAAAIYMVFILIATLTVMNMLMGVLVQIIGAVSDVEREEMTVQWVKVKLMEMLESTDLDKDGNMQISKSEFQRLLLNPKAAKMVQDVGVDVVGLVDFSELIFENDRELTFPEFMEWVLQLRGSNVATVKDIVDLRRFLSLELQDVVETVLTNMTKDSVTEMKKEFRQAFTEELALNNKIFKSTALTLDEV